MSLPVHYIRRCLRPTCRFRFPVGPGQPDHDSCPKCGAPLQRVENPYTDLKVEPSRPALAGLQVEALLDNIRSALNVGAIFRISDGAGVRHVHLAGLTPPPDHPKVAKTALGAEYAVPWTLHWNAPAAALECKRRGLRLWALESSPQARPIFEAAAAPDDTPILLAVGNEVSGVDPGILEQCDEIVSIPMQGVKRSLNVAVAFGIAVYFLRFPRRA